MTNISIGQYLPFDSFVHRLDPRVKIIGVFLYIITIFFVNDFITYIPFIVLLIAILGIAKIPFKAIVKSLKPLIFIIVLTGVINLVTTPGKEIFTIWKFSITEEGVFRTAFTILRLVLNYPFNISFNLHHKSNGINLWTGKTFLTNEKIWFSSRGTCNDDFNFPKVYTNPFR